MIRWLAVRVCWWWHNRTHRYRHPAQLIYKLELAVARDRATRNNKRWNEIAGALNELVENEGARAPMASPDAPSAAAGSVAPDDDREPFPLPGREHRGALANSHTPVGRSHAGHSMSTTTLGPRTDGLR